MLSQWSTGLGRGHPFEPGDVATRIRSITERHSLLPASYSRISDSVPCGFACPNVKGGNTGFPRSAFPTIKWVT
jgi:hypothetical protein